MDAAAFVVLLLTVFGQCRHLTAEWQLLADDEGGLHQVDLSAPSSVAPSESVEANVTFKLFTRLNPEEAQVLKINDSSSLGNANPLWPIKITAHGWQGAESSFTPTKDAWLAAGDCNVIMVDWSQLAADINYVNVKQYVQPVGQLAAQLVDWLVTTQGFRLSDVELVGHSLGGHVVGLIGSNVASGTVPLVTALDPARPLFEDEIPELRLDASDGDFVQVIHTNAGNLGLWEAVGTVDFYPNGGEIMAGCEPDYLGTCSHGRSRDYFTESVNSVEGFVAFACLNWTVFDQCVGGDIWALMGEGVTLTGSSSALYYLRTAASPPFALGFDNV